MPNIILVGAREMAPHLAQFHAKRPLVHCMTNDVVQNFTANVLLASGAIPAMVIAKEEAAEFVSISNALLINVGTITEEFMQAMTIAVKTAHQKGIPWVLDPVAIGPVLPFRTVFCDELLAYKPTIIRGNPSEILALAGEKSSAKGPDGMDDPLSALKTAQSLAKKLNTVVAMTGDIDYITDGETTYSINVGSEKLTRVTGAGCSLSALVAGFVGAGIAPLEAATSACFMMAYSGMKADQLTAMKQMSMAGGMGSFSVALLDELSTLSADRLSMDELNKTIQNESELSSREKFNADDLRLYLVLEPTLCGGIDGMLTTTQQAVKAGVTMVQLRFEEKTDKGIWYDAALRLKALLKPYNVPLIINDEVDVAIAVDADGVHVGQSDLPPNVVRELLGEDKIVGLSAGNASEILAADQNVVDYLGVGPVFTTSTKLDARAMLGPETLTELVELSPLPLVGIGGIQTSNVESVMRAGVSGVSVVSAICGQQDVEAATRILRTAIDRVLEESSC